MFFYKQLIEFLLTIVASNCYNFFILDFYFFQTLYFFLLSFFFLILLHRLNCWSKIFRGGFPILSSFSFVESFALGHSHLLLFFDFILFNDCGLYKIMLTCSFETNRLAYELNSFLFDMKTSLHALACFSRAFLLNFLPQP